MPTTTEIFRTPEERFADLPDFEFEPHYLEVDGLRLHYLDEGSGRPVICLHGEPTWAYLYRRIAPRLVEAGRRVICPDLAGFGRSDKPTDRRWYTYDRHVDVMSALLAVLDPTDAVVVVHDWGGPIGLRWAVENAERVSELVILNTGLYVGYTGEAFTQWRRFVESNPDLPIGVILQGGTKNELPAEVVAAYEAPFPTPGSKAGAVQFPMLVPLTNDDPGAAEMTAVREELRRWDKPALVAFSDADPIFPYPVAGELFTGLMPGAAPQRRIEGGAHFLQEDAPDLIASEILAFLET